MRGRWWRKWKGKVHPWWHFLGQQWGEDTHPLCSFPAFSFGWGCAWACLPPKRYRYTGLAACENKWGLLKYSKTGEAVWGEDEIHPDGDGPLQAESQGCKCRALRQSAWDARVLSSDGANAVQMMQRALPLFPAPLNRPVISFT